MSLRLATWNMQTLFPVRPNGKWGYLDEVIDADIAILTEAKPDVESRYQQVYQDGGLGKGRRWGTIVAARPPYSLVETRFVRRRFGSDVDLYNTWPGSVVVCDVLREGTTVLTVAGVYAVTVDREGVKTGNGWHTTKDIFRDLAPLIAKHRNDLIVGGDLNLWPDDAHRRIPPTVVDLVEHTAPFRAPSPDCVCRSPKPCHHIWTHNNSIAGKFQQIDYLFATRRTVKRIKALSGGPDDFADIWSWSDHAPLIAELSS
jgi:hypothetical protein